MAEFSRLVITNKGQALLAKMMTGEGNVEFTKISTSDMEYTLEQLEALTEFSGVKQTVSVAKVTRTNGVAVTIEAIFNNLELTQGYHMRALGLYAIDPDDGEILYAVTAEMSGCCYMPAYNGVTVSGACIKLVTTVGNAENVSLEVDPGVYATVGEIKELRETVANTYLNKTGNSADNTVTFTQASERTQIQSGEKHETLFGKVKKWFSDLKAVAFSGSYNDLSDKPDAQSVGALPDTGGVIANDSDRSITIQPTYIQGDGTQRLTDFYKISADSVEGNCLYYGNDDTDERYVKRENVLKTMAEVDSDTSEENIAGAAAVRKLKSDLENNINQINSNLIECMGVVYSNASPNLYERMKYLIDNRMLPTDKPFIMREGSYGIAFIAGQIYADYQYGEFLFLSHGNTENAVLFTINAGTFSMYELANLSNAKIGLTESIVNNINYEENLTRTYQLETNKAYLVTVFAYSFDNADAIMNSGAYFVYTPYNKNANGAIKEIYDTGHLTLNIDSDCILTIKGEYRYMHYSITKL